MNRRQETGDTWGLLRTSTAEGAKSKLAPIVLVAALMAGLAGCGGSAGEDAQTLGLTRMVTEDAADPFTKEDLLSSTTVFDWPFDTPADLDAWETENVASFSFLADGGVRLVDGAGRPAPPP